MYSLPVVPEELQSVIGSFCLHRSRALLYRLDRHHAEPLAALPFAFPGSPGDHPAIAAVLGEGGHHRLTRVPLHPRLIEAPAQIAAPLPLPSCFLLDWSRRGALGSNNPAWAIKRLARLRLSRVLPPVHCAGG